MSVTEIIEKLEALRGFYAGLRPELANAYVEALDVAIEAVKERTTGTYDASLFPGRLDELQAACGLSNHELARRSGLSAPSISRYRDGSREPKLSTVVSLAKALDAPLCHLAGMVTGDKDGGE